MTPLSGCEVSRDQFVCLLVQASKVTLTIDLNNDAISISLHNHCGGTTIFYSNEQFTPACVSNLNEYIRLSYASKEVCLAIVPKVGPRPDDINSMAQGLASLAEQWTKDFATADLYPKLQAAIVKSLETYQC